MDRDKSSSYLGARVLVDAAIAERIPIHIHESITFVYADGGTQSLGEDAPTDDGGTANLRAALDGEGEAARFSLAGGPGIVLRFGLFYAPDAPSTIEMMKLTRRRMLPQIGPGRNYVSSIFTPDAGRAVAAVGAPAGIYNVCDDNPVTFAEYLRILAGPCTLHGHYVFRGRLGGWIFGEMWRFFDRSQRVSNARVRKVCGWAPTVKDVSEGWPLIAAQAW